MSTNESAAERCWFVVLDRAAVEQAYSSYIVNIVLNSFLAPPTVIFNIIVIISIWRTSSLHTPSNLLISSLSLSDLLVGLITQPFYVAYKFSEINNQFEDYCEVGVQAIALLSSYFLAGASFFILTAMSLDRCLALHLGLRYRSTVTQSRIIKVLVLLWAFAAFTGSMQVFLDLQVFFKVITAIMVICLATTTIAYLKAYMSLRRHQVKVRARENAASGFRQVNTYRKSLRALKYLLGSILLCYVPHTLVYVAIASQGLNAVTRAAKNIVNPIVFANSCLNPVIYCWKIKEIRKACRNTLRNVFPACGRQHGDVVSPDNESQLSVIKESPTRSHSRNGGNMDGNIDRHCGTSANNNSLVDLTRSRQEQISGY